eukprot:6200624-Pleurochrysis_carterae.AAC.2
MHWSAHKSQCTGRLHRNAAGTNDETSSPSNGGRICAASTRMLRLPGTRTQQTVERVPCSRPGCRCRLSRGVRCLRMHVRAPPLRARLHVRACPRATGSRGPSGHHTRLCLEECADSRSW